MRMHHSQHDVFGDRRPESGHPLRKPLGHAAYLQRQSAVPDGFIKTIINLMGRIVKVTADTIWGIPSEWTRLRADFRDVHWQLLFPWLEEGFLHPVLSEEFRS